MPSRPSCAPGVAPSATIAQRSGPRLTELAAHAGPDAGQLSAAEVVRLTLDDQRERALPDEVDLLLALVIVHAPALARGEDYEIHADAAQLERPSQRDEALAAVEGERGAGEAGVGHPATLRGSD